MCASRIFGHGWRLVFEQLRDLMALRLCVRASRGCEVKLSSRIKNVFLRDVTRNMETTKAKKVLRTYCISVGSRLLALECVDY